ncbi:hypothetical protein RSOL_511730 [Rhizoctonia solani AG-3 Rhs1AP]|uniref:Uncharacterized protein n=1 Tax=Rhizoctonia solani AG-3 Rhs1AP TaxID=1086054 RepID=X8JWE5_9AGAM|nr:hypothetical protein RSOL_511730 [Rhizoctonia solani AG-3 Rhs1AP]
MFKIEKIIQSMHDWLVQFAKWPIACPYSQLKIHSDTKWRISFSTRCTTWEC